MDDLIEALQIMSKYDKPAYPTHCEHDELFVFVDPSLVTPEDLGKLRKLGFFADEGEQCFKSYRFGSA